MSSNPSSDLATARATVRHLADRSNLAQLEQVIQFFGGLGLKPKKPAAKPPKDTTPKHCVRCHATYSDATNGRTSCVIFHAFEEGGRFAGMDAGGYTLREYSCVSCNRATAITRSDEGDEENEGDEGLVKLIGKEHCWRGVHTTRPDKVDYQRINVTECELQDGKCTSDYEAEFWFHTY